MTEERLVIDRLTQKLSVWHFGTYDLGEAHETITLRIKVQSGEFIGINDFDLFTQDLKEVVRCLKEVYDANGGTCRIDDSESDSFMLIEEHRGQVSISGQLGTSIYGNYLVFKLDTDQTELPALIRAFEDVIPH